ncbi:unnamed protein product [Arctogadus glacialis]
MRKNSNRPNRVITAVFGTSCGWTGTWHQGHPLNTPQRRFSHYPRALHPSWPGLSLGWGSGNVGVFMWGSVGVSGSPAASSIATCQPTDRYLCS